MALDVVTLVGDGGVRHGILSIYGPWTLRRKHDFRRPIHSLLNGFNDRCALASTTLGSLSDIEDDLKGECLDIFSDVS